MAKRLSSELFVSRLSFYTTEDGLRKLFSRFGMVKEARIVRDPRNGRPKGFGFVSYDSETEAHKALSGLNGRIIDGRLIFVEFAKKHEGGPQKDQK
ncbi:small RNA-binding protein 11, chloroplastic [Punica granatum]|uniref:Small RNA-binding protein 11, chloroplastic n=1 Tax=Punica granatum TaxID=22663 RepID=A0A6P8E7U2_PUNGR|nr:small RNA-binding protein 11, chloroplastic [Punica granatum]XP_031401397.1 small RNA-binding protein 11, chloroplastic [Punica granatum]